MLDFRMVNIFNLMDDCTNRQSTFRWEQIMHLRADLFFYFYETSQLTTKNYLETLISFVTTNITSY